MPTYSSEWDPGDARANNEHRARMGFGGTEHGGQQYAQRSRMLGDEAKRRAAYVSDMGQSNQARGTMGTAAGLIESAARGQQPSQAEILSRQNTAASMRAGQSLAAGVKGGPGARVAAMRNAQRMAAQTSAEGASRTEALRANEIATARGQLAGVGQAMRAGDLDAARIQQANELTQRGQNDAMERFYETQGFNTQVQDQNNQLQQQGMATGAWNAGRGSEQADEQFGFGKMMKYGEAIAGAVGGATSGAAGAMTSDEAAKNLIPAGSLAILGRVPGTGGGAAIKAGAGPSDGATIAGGFHGGTSQLGAGGGMDVMSQTKWNNNELRGMARDPSGGMVTSDWRSKDIMYSPGEIKNPATLDDAMAQSAEGATPYATTPDTGVAGAPRGYAAARAGQAGSMFAPPPAEAAPEQGAPGTDDWQKYGAGGQSALSQTLAKPGSAKAREAGVDWKHGGTTTPKGHGGVLMGSLSGFLNGLSSGASMRSDMKSKDGVMYSDDKTKLAAAYEAGKAAAGKAAGAKPEIGGKVKDAVKNATGEDAKKIRDVAIAAGGRVAMSPAAAPNNLVDEASDQLRIVADAKPEDARAAMPSATAVEYAAPVLGPIGGALATRLARSDEKAKNVIDLDEGSDKASMRDGSSDARTNSFDKSFRRDSRSEQAAKGKAYKKASEDRASKEADAMMAGFGASLKKGPSSRSEDLQDDAPDLREAAKAGSDAGRIPEHAMFKAMKAMEPSLYSYKPEFRPPEQAPGEVQAGPMANNMERDPIAGTAITRDPGTGLLAIDKDKALKLTMGSLAVLADDVEALKRKKKGGR